MTHITPAAEHIDLRRGIDHIGVGIVCIVHDGTGRMLLMKRGPKARDEQGRWDVCGGAIEFGETVDQAIARELFEELCTEPLSVEFVTATDVHREHEGNRTHWVQLVHIVKVDPDTVSIGEPHKISEIGWFDLNNLPEPRHSQFGKVREVAIASGILV